VLTIGGAIAGIGFTVSLLISTLAFHGRRLDEAKLGVLAAAVLASLGGWLAVQVLRRLPASVRGRQLLKTSDRILDLSSDVDPERDHVRGGESALVTLVEYGDYECPYCRQAEVVINDLLEDFGEDLRYVWRHLPLSDVHRNAQVAAEAAEAAAAQGAFWEMHEALLAQRDDERAPDLDRYADELGLDVDRFREDLRTHRYAPRIAEDVASADASGVAGTPSFFLNGTRHQGAYDIASLTTAIGALRRRERLRAGALGAPG
jgi:protein-disulfide isomerase